ncbi:MAG: ElyC/SanA/YdcF family protein [Myxococcota bacterium]
MPAARSTVENALLCVPLLRARDVHTLFLVTERYHMRRAARVFRAAAPEIVVVPNPAPDTVVGLRRLRRMGIEQLKLARDLAYIARLSARAS